MHNTSKIALLGGSGRTAQFVIKELLRQKYQPKILVRNSLQLPYNDGEIEVVQGDALEKSSVMTLLKGCTAVINTMGQRKDEPLVATAAQKNILQSMQHHGISRYILLTGINVDAPGDEKGVQTQAATSWMASHYPTFQRDRQNALGELLTSSIDWTVVRVPMIVFTDEPSSSEASLKDCGSTSITAGNIAKFLVSQLRDTRYLKACPFIFNN